MSRAKRTANVDAEIRARSRAGLSARQIAKEKGLSRQTVDRALASMPAPTVAEVPTAKTKTKATSTAERSTSTEPADIDELRTLLAELARGLTAQAREAQSKGDQAAYASLAGKAQASLMGLAKLSPAAPEAEQEGTYISHAEMAKAAAAARTAILERVARRSEGRS